MKLAWRLTILVLTVLAVGVLFYISRQEKQQEVGDEIIAKFSAYQKSGSKKDFSWTLDCPPLGKQSVQFHTAETTANAPGNPALQNTVLIARRWSEMWSSAYGELDNAIINQNLTWGDLGPNPPILVDLPDNLLDETGAWSITIKAPAGSFAALMVGSKTASVSFSPPK